MRKVAIYGKGRIGKATTTQKPLAGLVGIPAAGVWTVEATTTPEAASLELCVEP